MTIATVACPCGRVLVVEHPTVDPLPGADIGEAIVLCDRKHRAFSAGVELAIRSQR